jgi:diketogulonate reductase-like aldo/keto reductase
VPDDLICHCCRTTIEVYNCAHLCPFALQSLARQAVAEYVKVAEKHGLTPSELAIAWCDSRWFMASTIIGATSLDQLKVPLCNFCTCPLPHSCTMWSAMLHHSPVSGCQQRSVIPVAIGSSCAFAWKQENIGAFDKELSAEAIEDVEKVYRKRKDPAVRDVSDD